MNFSNKTLMYIAYGLIAIFFILLIMRNISFQTNLIEGFTTNTSVKKELDKLNSQISDIKEPLIDNKDLDTFLDKYETLIKVNFIDEVSNKLNTDIEFLESNEGLKVLESLDTSERWLKAVTNARQYLKDVKSNSNATKKIKGLF